MPHAPTTHFLLEEVSSWAEVNEQTECSGSSSSRPQAASTESLLFFLIIAVVIYFVCACAHSAGRSEDNGWSRSSPSTVSLSGMEIGSIGLGRRLSLPTGPSLHQPRCYSPSLVLEAVVSIVSFLWSRVFGKAACSETGTPQAFLASQERG